MGTPAPLTWTVSRPRPSLWTARVAPCDELLPRRRWGLSVTSISWHGYESDRPRAERAIARCLRDLRAVAEGLDMGSIDITLEPCRGSDLSFGFTVWLVLFGPWSCGTFLSAELDEEGAVCYLIERFSGDFTEALAARSIPRARRHSFITAALDAGVPLRDVQEAASHSDPRTTMRYDRARVSLDRHATYIVATYMAGASR